MKSRRLGRTGLVVSEIGLGTMTFGSMADEAESVRMLDCALDAGVDLIDVAEIYPVPPRAEWAGASEEIVGKWLAGRPRDKVILATKVAGPGRGWFQAPLRHGHTALDRHHIERAVEGSLRRLGTDYLDLYQTHWPDPGVPVEDTLEALDRLVEEGKLRAIGCSNQTAWGLARSLWMAERHGTARYETIQNNFSLLNRRFEDELARICQDEQLSLLAYSPLAGGVLSGKYQGGAWPDGARFTRYREENRRTQSMTRRFVSERTLTVTERIHALAADCGASAVAFSLAWTLTRPFVGSSLVGATSVAQLEESLAAAELSLSADALAECDRLARETPYPMG